MPFIKGNIKLHYFGPKFSMHFFFQRVIFPTGIAPLIWCVMAKSARALALCISDICISFPERRKSRYLVGKSHFCMPCRPGVLWGNEKVSSVLSMARRAEKTNDQVRSVSVTGLTLSIAPRNERHHGNKKKWRAFPPSFWGYFEGRNFSLPFFSD